MQGYIKKLFAIFGMWKKIRVLKTGNKNQGKKGEKKNDRKSRNKWGGGERYFTSKREKIYHICIFFHLNSPGMSYKKNCKIFLNTLNTVHLSANVAKIC